MGKELSELSESGNWAPSVPISEFLLLVSSEADSGLELFNFAVGLQFDSKLGGHRDDGFILGLLFYGKCPHLQQGVKLRFEAFGPMLSQVKWKGHYLLPVRWRWLEEVRVCLVQFHVLGVTMVCCIIAELNVHLLVLGHFRVFKV